LGAERVRDLQSPPPKLFTNPFSCLVFCSFPLQMNQTCKVCGEPAAGFHFGAFTCEGCKVSSMLGLI